MNVLYLGKFPPLQGGVSSTAWRLMTGVAGEGHRVDVVTNATDASSSQRVHYYHLRDDFSQTVSSRGTGIFIHLTDPQDDTQRHIPNDNPVVTKLASLGLSAANRNRPDVIFSFYLEPYAVAGHLISRAISVPHVVRTAGSDTGRLWNHPQLGPAYSLLLEEAAAVWASGPTARRLIDEGIRRDRIFGQTVSRVPEGLFQPEGPHLDIRHLAKHFKNDKQVTCRGNLRGLSRPIIGMYGKLSRSKGVFDLLHSLAKLRAVNHEFKAVFCAQGSDEATAEFWNLTQKLDLLDHVLQLPFIPYHQIPSFIRSCSVVCCLEQDFEIKTHSPIIAREVLTCGGVLLGSTEILQKVPSSYRLVDGFNCMAVDDVTDSKNLATKLGYLLADKSAQAFMGREGRAVASEIQNGIDDVRILTSILSQVSVPNPSASRRGKTGRSDSTSRFDEIPERSVGELKKLGYQRILAELQGKVGSANWCSQLLNRLASGSNINDERIALLSEILRLWNLRRRAMVRASRSRQSMVSLSALRLTCRAGAVNDQIYGKLIPVVSPKLELTEFSYDVDQLITKLSRGEFPRRARKRRTFVASPPPLTHPSPRILVLDETAYDLLLRCDGRTQMNEFGDDGMAELATGERSAQLMIREFFLSGLVNLSRAGKPSKGIRHPDGRPARPRS